ncbi:MAG: DUF4189 domain-containing protein, partial [Rhodospirillaceae bacterium]|nr:DUF4189 domain-containing protein [Rhodospirillaceae bacterium]
MGGMACLRPSLILVIFSVAAAGAVHPASAQNYWGAVATGPGGGMVQAIGQPSRAAARAAALRDCRGRCRYLVTFYRSCAAIATGTGAYGWAAGGGLHAVGAQALRFCRQRAADCRLRAV